MLHLCCSLRYPLMLAFQSMTSNVNIYQFDQHVITVEYKKETMSYPFWSRNLWDWAVDTIKHPLVGPHFVWDAQRLSKFNGTEWMWCYESHCYVTVYFRVSSIYFTSI